MQVNGQSFTIGADPEVFVGSADTGKFISGHDLVQGTKENPFVVEKGAVQVDGMALEFNIDPAKNFEEFMDNILSVQDTLAGMIGDKKFLDVASVFFTEEDIQGVPDFNLMLGCEPDYNGWTGDVNASPDATAMMRTVGGHVHLGGFHTDDEFSPQHFGACARLARILDYTLGAYSVLWDKDDQRRAMYGKAGSFRPKKYGMEYRTLSNRWIFDPKLIAFVYDGAQRALELMFDNSFDVDENVRRIIDKSERNSSFFQEEGNQSYTEMLA